MEDGKIIIYKTPDGDTVLDVTLENDTIWLTQKEIMIQVVVNLINGNN